MTCMHDAMDEGSETNDRASEDVVHAATSPSMSSKSQSLAWKFLWKPCGHIVAAASDNRYPASGSSAPSLLLNP